MSVQSCARSAHLHFSGAGRLALILSAIDALCQPSCTGPPRCRPVVQSTEIDSYRKDENRLRPLTILAVHIRRVHWLLAAVVYDMANRGLMRDLGPLGLDPSAYLDTAIRVLSDGTQVFGLPLSGHTHGLFYDNKQVETPPATVAELLERIEGGDILLQNPNLLRSYWGVGSFDGAFADQDRRLLFGQGGFTDWPDFLYTARTLPGFALDESDALLDQAFIDGEGTYYVGDSHRIPTLLNATGPDRLSVHRCPPGAPTAAELPS